MPINITKGGSEQEFNVGTRRLGEDTSFENENKRSLTKRFEEN
jgi:hypothetical protein